MGGPGFFGVELEATAVWPREHLVLTLWGAAGWLLLDGEWVEAHPDQYSTRRPLFSNISTQRTTLKWDKVTALLVDGVIDAFELHKNSCALSLTTRNERHLLELPEDTSRLPLHGNRSPREWSPEEDIANAWVICDDNLVL
jgi:hypothetical protein